MQWRKIKQKRLREHSEEKVILNRGVKEGLDENLTFEQTLARRKGVSHANTQGRTFQALGTAIAKVLRQKHFWYAQGIADFL